MFFCLVGCKPNRGSTILPKTIVRYKSKSKSLISGLSYVWDPNNEHLPIFWSCHNFRYVKYLDVCLLSHVSAWHGYLLWTPPSHSMKNHCNCQRGKENPPFICHVRSNLCLTTLKQHKDQTYPILIAESPNSQKKRVEGQTLKQHKDQIYPILIAERGNLQKRSWGTNTHLVFCETLLATAEAEVYISSWAKEWRSLHLR